MASEELPWSGLKVTCQIDIKLLNIKTMNQNLVKYYAESPKVYIMPNFISDLYKWLTIGFELIHAYIICSWY